MVPGQGKIRTTGKLGDVMKESIDAASSFVRSGAVSYGIEPPILKKRYSCSCSRRRNAKRWPFSWRSYDYCYYLCNGGNPCKK